MQEKLELNKLLAKYVDGGHYPGFQWQIQINDKKYSGKYGYNNIESKKPVLENTIYRIWSMTKPIVAIVALKLIEQKKLNFNDPINKFLPEFNNLKVMSKENGNIDEVNKVINFPKIKDLLLHTAGFSYNMLDDPIGLEYEKIKLFHSDSTSLEEEIIKLAKIPLLFEPKTKWRYSVSMDVLGRIIEIVKNNSLQNILQEEIFNPLEMYETNFSIPKNAEDRLMESYAYDNSKSELINYYPGLQKIENYQYPLNEKRFARGGHGLFSTIKDYSIFAKMLQTGKTEKGQAILSKNSLKLINTNALEDYYFPLEIRSVGTVIDVNYVNDLEPYGWGMGFRTLIDQKKNNNLGSVGEFGWSGAASTYFLVDNDKDMTALLMTQVFSGNPDLKKDFYKFIYTNF